MTKDVKKTIRFTVDEFKSIETKLDEYKLDFTTFAKNAILKNKIHYKFQIQALYHLNAIQLQIEDIAKAINKEDKRLVLEQLYNIENKLNDLL